MKTVHLCAIVPALLAGAFALPGSRAGAQDPHNARDAAAPILALVDTGAVAGVVVDSGSGQPLTAARVRLAQLHREELTHEDGSFRLDGVPAGRYELTVHRIGYAAATRSIVVEGDRETTIRVAMRAAAIQLSQVVVTGTVSARGVEQTIQPTNVVSQQELDRKLSATIGATLQEEPGVAVVSSGPATARPIVRGLGGDRIIMLEDGARSGDLSSATTDHAVAIDPLTASQIEVVRGPATLLYGSNALGGVVNVIREEIPTSPVDRTHGTVTVNGQTVNDGGGVGALVTTPVSVASLRLEASMRDAGDLRTPLGRMENSGVRTYNGALGLGFVEEWGHVGGAARYFQSRYGIPPDPAGGHEEGVEIDMERWVAKGEIERHWNDGLLSSALLEAGYTRYHHRELEPGGIVGTEFGLLTSQADGLLRHRSIGPFTEGAAGFRVQWRDYASAGSQLSPPTNDYVVAGFLLEEMGTGAARLQVGARYDWHRVVPHLDEPSPIGDVRTRTFGAFSGAIGGLYEIIPDVRIGASVSRAFRAPDLTELFSEGPHLAVYRDERGNPELDEEIGLGMDAFVRLSRERIQAEVAVFRNQIDDFIYARNTGEPSPRDPALDLYVYTGGDALLTGGEAQVTWNVLRSLVAEGTISHVRGELRTTGEALPRMPPLNGRLAMRIETPGWFGGLGMRASARQDRVGEFEEPTSGFAVFDFTLGYRWTMHRNFHTITLRADNLLDREYREHLSSLKEILPEPGRNISLLYRLSF